MRWLLTLLALVASMVHAQPVTRLVVPFAAIKAFWDKSELKCSDG